MFSTFCLVSSVYPGCPFIILETVAVDTPDCLATSLIVGLILMLILYVNAYVDFIIADKNQSVNKNIYIFIPYLEKICVFLL